MLRRAPTTPRTRRRRHHHLAVAALLIGAAVALSGCAQIRAYDLRQLGSIGDIDIVLDGCGSQAGNPDCGLGSSGLESNATGTGQVLLGFKIDARFALPAAFATDGLSSLGGHQPFTASPSYTAELTRLDPPGPGLKWAGYISDARTYTPGKLVGARVPITRPLLPDGSPNGRTVFVSWRIGSRGVLADAPATRPVTCGDSLTQVFQADLTICSDESGSIGVFDFNDFGFLTPAAVTVQPGQTAVIPVSAKLTGPTRPGINFALRTTTTVPGTTAVTNVPTLAPQGDSTTSVTVSVPVPPGTAPGTYAVTLTGTLPSGEARATTGTVIVAGPGGAPGGGTAAAPLCAGRLATVTGTAGPDRLQGTAGPDVIAGLGGDDVVDGLGGADVLCGGPGADLLRGGEGRDVLVGGAGPDRLLGGLGPDRLVGGPGADRLIGGRGLDVLIGGAGRNVRIQ
ncbi:MAG TPA: hypothetical protein PKD59_06640 [Miltoncostaeaceae bacterium]|nr:hypothetical protein [Miltoncostaeaceae bacterium]